MAPSPTRSIADCRVEFRALDTHIDVAANNGRPSPLCFQRTRRAGPPTSPPASRLAHLLRQQTSDVAKASGRPRPFTSRPLLHATA